MPRIPLSCLPFYLFASQALAWHQCGRGVPLPEPQKSAEGERGEARRGEGVCDTRGSVKECLAASFTEGGVLGVTGGFLSGISFEMSCFGAADGAVCHCRTASVGCALVLLGRDWEWPGFCHGRGMDGLMGGQDGRFLDPNELGYLRWLARLGSGLVLRGGRGRGWPGDMAALLFRGGGRWASTLCDGSGMGGSSGKRCCSRLCK